MGLDLHLVRVDYDGPHARWAHSGFMEFRRRLAKEIGVDLDEMEGFKKIGGGRRWAEVLDPLVPLLDHSDCDGWLDYDACVKVAPRLREIVEPWPRDYDRQQALALVAMMEEVVEGDAEMVVFQ